MSMMLSLLLNRTRYSLLSTALAKGNFRNHNFSSYLVILCSPCNVDTYSFSLFSTLTTPPNNNNVVKNSDRNNNDLDGNDVTIFAREKTWDKHFESLKEFVAENGHSNVPRNHNGSRALNSWVCNQRGRYHKRLLTWERIEKLESLGIVWSWSVHAEHWDDMFAAYQKFANQHGHLDLTKASKSIKYWCTVQRREYKRLRGMKASETTQAQNANDDDGVDESTDDKGLSNDRIKKLEAIGFPWDVHDAFWESKYNQLEIYQKENGHCLIKKSDDEYGLYKWVDLQRQEYRHYLSHKDEDTNDNINNKKETIKSSMTKERIDKLNALGFIWNVYEYKWNLKFVELKKFITKNGKGSMPPGSSKLFRWIQYQTSLYKKKMKYPNKNVSLTDERVTKLKSLGFLL